MVKGISHISRHAGSIVITTILIFLYPGKFVTAQNQTYRYFYRIYFRDKGDKSISEFNSADLLSKRAVERRLRNEIPILDYRDIPVFQDYIDEISSLGLKLHCTSKWMNTALFKTRDPVDPDYILQLPFVSNVKIVKNISGNKSQYDKLSFQTNKSDQPVFNNPVMQLNGLLLHESGFTGREILIAVLDGGFFNSDRISSLHELRDRNGITATYDLIEKNEFVYDYHTHGTAVLSILSGMIPESIQGSAPGSDFILLRTEDVSSEFPVEEDFWTAGAEFADSAGADIISSSLGYFNFDDPSMNYKYSDMDGNRTFVTVAADIAASKGILVVSSAGNERDDSWKYIIAPSDGDSVLAIGAVDGNEIISPFSSAGPSYDKRIKPDLMAQGVSVPLQIKSDIVERGNGTSFSCPVISGICACIMQAVPRATNFDILAAVRSSADRFLVPDSLYGYGIPDMVEVLRKLQQKYIAKHSNESVGGPNPFYNELKFYFNEDPEWLRIEILNVSGTLIYKKEYRNYISRAVVINDIQQLAAGLYFVRLHTALGTHVHKVVKARSRP